MRNVLQNLTILGISVALGILAFLLFDFFVISHSIEEPGSGDRYGYLRYEDGWYALAPNVRVASAWGKTVYPWRTDANGFRINHNRTSASGPAEIIFLGDSFTFGMGLPWEDTFVGIYEKGSSGPVINAGVSSWSPTPYLWQYKRAISAGVLRTPHAAIVAIDISDVQDEAAIWEDGQDHPRRRNYPTSSAQISLQPTSSLKGFFTSRLLGTSRIFRMIRYQIIQDSPVNEDPFDQIRSAFTWRSWDAIESAMTEAPGGFERIGYQPLGVRGGLAAIRDKLATISSIARENNSDLWILIYPWPAQLRHPSTIFDWEQFNVDMCHDIKCRGVINTFPRFRSLAVDSDWYDKLYVHGDIHFNKFGNQVIADVIKVVVK